VMVKSAKPVTGTASKRPAAPLAKTAPPKR